MIPGGSWWLYGGPRVALTGPRLVLGGSRVVRGGFGISYLLVEPAALDHRGVEVPLDGVGPLAEVVDLLGGRAGRLRRQRRARQSNSDVTKMLIVGVHFLS